MKCPHCDGEIDRISYMKGEYYCVECNCEFYGKTKKEAIEEFGYLQGLRCIRMYGRMREKGKRQDE